MFFSEMCGNTSWSGLENEMPISMGTSLLPSYIYLFIYIFFIYVFFIYLLFKCSFISFSESSFHQLFIFCHSFILSSVSLFLYLYRYIL